MQLSLELKVLEPLLTQGFVAYDGYGITQVKGPDLIKHGNSDTGLLILH